jgi:hypothetical protein
VDPTSKDKRSYDWKAAWDEGKNLNNNKEPVSDIPNASAL